MAYNASSNYGFAFEAEYLDPDWTPAVDDVWYRFGEDATGRVTVEQAVHQLLAGNAYYPNPSPGQRLARARLSFKGPNYAWDYATLGKFSSSEGVHTIEVLTTPDLPSMRLHEERTGAAQSLVRDVLGVKVASHQWAWDRRAGAELVDDITLVGALVRSDQHATKPAVALTADYSDFGQPRPLTWEPAYSHVYWDAAGTPVVVVAEQVIIEWDNALNSPAYVQGGSTANGSSDYWPVAIRKRNPGSGRFSLNLWMDKRWPHEAAIGQLEEDIEVKLSCEGGDYYKKFTLADANPTRFETLLALDSPDLALVTLQGSFGNITIECVDGYEVE